MKPVKEKEFVMFRPKWRIEEDSNFEVDNTPETFFATRLGFEVRKLHV